LRDEIEALRDSRDGTDKRIVADIAIVTMSLTFSLYLLTLGATSSLELIIVVILVLAIIYCGDAIRSFSRRHQTQINIEQLWERRREMRKQVPGTP
jgi:hypothetical protein